MQRSRKSMFLLLSFIEGGAVMVCELVSAKMLSPFFGTSITVWAAVLGLTLGGLTTGYFAGGKLSNRFGKSTQLLYWVLITGGILLIAMPFIGNFIMEIMLNTPLEIGAITSLICFMVPPLVFMGMVSPIIINLLTEDVEGAGNNAGTVYAISTIGGIFATFLFGFYIIPNFGLKGPSVFMGIFLMIIPLIKMVNINKSGALSVLGMLIGFSFLSMTYTIEYTDEYKVLYESEGILGQVKVVDHPSYGISVDNREGRALIVNNTLQTYVDKADDLQYSLWNWANYFPTAASIYPKGSDVLLLGLGGGTLVKQLNRIGFNVDVVEIDKRILDVSLEYFNLDPEVNCVIDDARHHIRTTNKKYDIIIFDTFLSESVPEHLITREGIADADHILKEGGMLMVNFYGAVEGENGIAARSVQKTFEDQGYMVNLLATPGQEVNRNIIFLCSKVELDFSKADYDSKKFSKILNIRNYFIDTDGIDYSDALILTDSKPQLSKLYMPMARKWKVSYNQYYRKNFMK